jgi:hypothetical protein
VVSCECPRASNTNVSSWEWLGVSNTNVASCEWSRASNTNVASWECPRISNTNVAASCEWPRASITYMDFREWPRASNTNVACHGLKKPCDKIWVIIVIVLFFLLVSLLLKSNYTPIKYKWQKCQCVLSTQKKWVFRSQLPVRGLWNVPQNMTYFLVCGIYEIMRTSRVWGKSHTMRDVNEYIMLRECYTSCT